MSNPCQKCTEKHFKYCLDCAAFDDEDPADIIEDGFDSAWSAYCEQCGQRTMQIVRPGKAQCAECG